MVNKNFYLGILVMVLVFGMTVVGNIEAQTENSGEFILTDIPAKYNGKYAVLTSLDVNSKVFLTTSESSAEVKTFPIIGGKVIIPLLDYNRNFERYSGNDTLVIFIYIYEKENTKDRNNKILEKIEFYGGKTMFDSKTNYVQFSNGSATRSYKDKSLVIKL